jgi:hypothetical protein
MNKSLASHRAGSQTQLTPRPWRISRYRRGMGRTVRGNPQGGALGRVLPAVPGRCLPPRSPRGDPMEPVGIICGWGDRTARHFAKAGPAGQLQTASKCRALLTREVSAVAPEERRSHGPRLRALAYCKPRAGRVIPPSPSRLHRSVRGNERMVRSMERGEPSPSQPSVRL